MTRGGALLLLLCLWAAPAQAELRILATGDLHGWLSSTLVRPAARPFGLFHLEGLIQARQTPNSLYLDTGDALYGALSSQYSGRKVSGLAPRLKALGLDALVPGEEDLALLHLDLPWVAANLKGAPQVKPYRVFQRSGRKVAVLGLANPASGLWVKLPPGINIGPPLEAAQDWVPKILAQEVPDLLVVLLHSGKRPEKDREGALLAGFSAGQGAEALAQALPQIDLILTGHDHWLYPRGPQPTHIQGVALAGPGSRGRALLELNLNSGSWRAKIHWAQPRSEEPPWPPGYVAWARELLPVDLAYSGAERQSACFEALAAASLRSPQRFGSALPEVYLRRGLRVSVLDRAALYRLFKHDDRPQEVLLSRRDLSLLAAPEAPPGRRIPPYSRRLKLDLEHPLDLSRDWLWPDSEALERKYRIALSGYHLRGGGAVVSKLFLEHPPSSAGLPLRESVFKYLQARKPLPEACDMLSYATGGDLSSLR